MSARSCSTAADSGSTADSMVSSAAQTQALVASCIDSVSPAAAVPAPVSASTPHEGSPTTAAASTSAIHLFFIDSSPARKIWHYYTRPVAASSSFPGKFPHLAGTFALPEEPSSPTDGKRPPRRGRRSFMCLYPLAGTAYLSYISTSFSRCS